MLKNKKFWRPPAPPSGGGKKGGAPPPYGGGAPHYVGAVVSKKKNAGGGGGPPVGKGIIYRIEAFSKEEKNRFWNQTFDKGRIKNFVLWFLKKNGEHKTVSLVEELKNVGFEYATKAGISLGIEDLMIPKSKYSLMAEAEELTTSTVKQYTRGEITGVERFQRLIDTWHRTSERLKVEVIKNFEAIDILNPVYMMAFSGARGNISQVRQLVGMRGLMSNPKGQIIDFPIRSNFREGLTLTEYIISSYGARKGIVDTALRTANAGYLTRRLVDVAQHVIISNFDCGTKRGIFLMDMKEGNKVIYSLQNRLLGRVLAEDVYNKEKIKVASKNVEISSDLANSITLIRKKVFVRSSLTCENQNLICQLCYGWSLSQGNLVSTGEAVGVIAGQSIGEPGTQLTMRTFHTGGVFSGGVSDQITAPFNGIVKYNKPIVGTLIRTPEGKIAFLTKSEGSFIVESLSISNLNKDAPHYSGGARFNGEPPLPPPGGGEPLKREPGGEGGNPPPPAPKGGHEGGGKIKKFKIPFSTLLFVKNGETVSEKEVIAQISSINRQKNTTDQAELTIKSDFAGQFYSKYLNLNTKKVGPMEKKREKKNEPKVFRLIESATDTLFEAWGWGYTWVLSGKIYQLALPSTFFPNLGDYINEKSYMNKIHWNIPSNLGPILKINRPMPLEFKDSTLLNTKIIKQMRAAHNNLLGPFQGPPGGARVGKNMSTSTAQLGSPPPNPPSPPPAGAPTAPPRGGGAQWGAFKKGARNVGVKGGGKSGTKMGSAKSNFLNKKELTLLKTELVSFQLSTILFKKIGYFLKLTESSSSFCLNVHNFKNYFKSSFEEQSTILSINDSLFLFSSIFSKKTMNSPGGGTRSAVGGGPAGSPTGKFYFGNILNKKNKATMENQFKYSVSPSNWNPSFDILLKWFPKRLSTKTGGLIFIEPNNNNTFKRTSFTSEIAKFQENLPPSYQVGNRGGVLVHGCISSLGDPPRSPPIGGSPGEPGSIWANADQKWLSIGDRLATQIFSENVTSINTKTLSSLEGSFVIYSKKLTKRGLPLPPSGGGQKRLPPIFKKNWGGEPQKGGSPPPGPGGVFLKRGGGKKGPEIQFPSGPHIPGSPPLPPPRGGAEGRGRLAGRGISDGCPPGSPGLPTQWGLWGGYGGVPNDLKKKADIKSQRIFWVSQPFFNISLKKNKIFFCPLRGLPHSRGGAPGGDPVEPEISTTQPPVVGAYPPGGLPPTQWGGLPTRWGLRGGGKVGGLGIGALDPILFQLNRQGNKKFFYSKESYIETDSFKNYPLFTYQTPPLPPGGAPHSVGATGGEESGGAYLIPFQKNTKDATSCRPIVELFYNLKKRKQILNLFFIGLVPSASTDKGILENNSGPPPPLGGGSLPPRGPLKKKVNLKMFSKMTSFPYFLNKKSFVFAPPYRAPFLKAPFLKAPPPRGGAVGAVGAPIGGKVGVARTANKKNNSAPPPPLGGGSLPPRGPFKNNKNKNYKKFFFNFYFYNLFNKTYHRAPPREWGAKMELASVDRNLLKLNFGSRKAPRFKPQAAVAAVDSLYLKDQLLKKSWTRFHLASILPHTEAPTKEPFTGHPQRGGCPVNGSFVGREDGATGGGQWRVPNCSFFYFKAPPPEGGSLPLGGPELERIKQLQVWFIKSTFYKKNSFKNIFKYNKKFYSFLLKNKLISSATSRAYVFLKQKLSSANKFLATPILDASPTHPPRSPHRVGSPPPRGGGSPPGVPHTFSNSNKNVNDLKMVLKQGWFYYSMTLNDFLLYNKKLIYPGKSLNNNLVFDRHSIFIEIVSFNKISLVKSFYDFSNQFFELKIDSLIRSKILTKKIQEELKLKNIYGVPTEILTNRAPPGSPGGLPPPLGGGLPTQWGLWGGSSNIRGGAITNVGAGNNECGEGGGPPFGGHKAPFNNFLQLTYPDFDSNFVLKRNFNNIKLVKTIQNNKCWFKPTIQEGNFNAFKNLPSSKTTGPRVMLGGHTRSRVQKKGLLEKQFFVLIRKANEYKLYKDIEYKKEISKISNQKEKITQNQYLYNFNRALDSSKDKSSPPPAPPGSPGGLPPTQWGGLPTPWGLLGGSVGAAGDPGGGIGGASQLFYNSRFKFINKSYNSINLYSLYKTGFLNQQKKTNDSFSRQGQSLFKLRCIEDFNLKNSAFYFSFFDFGYPMGGLPHFHRVPPPGPPLWGEPGGGSKSPPPAGPAVEPGSVEEPYGSEAKWSHVKSMALWTQSSSLLSPAPPPLFRGPPDSPPPGGESGGPQKNMGGEKSGAFFVAPRTPPLGGGSPGAHERISTQVVCNLFGRNSSNLLCLPIVTTKAINLFPLIISYKTSDLLNTPIPPGGLPPTQWGGRGGAREEDGSIPTFRWGYSGADTGGILKSDPMGLPMRVFCEQKQNNLFQGSPPRGGEPPPGGARVVTNGAAYPPELPTGIPPPGGGQWGLRGGGKGDTPLVQKNLKKILNAYSFKIKSNQAPPSPPVAPTAPPRGGGAQWGARGEGGDPPSPSLKTQHSLNNQMVGAKADDGVHQLRKEIYNFNWILHTPIVEYSLGQEFEKSISYPNKLNFIKMENKFENFNKNKNNINYGTRVFSKNFLSSTSGHQLLFGSLNQSFRVINAFESAGPPVGGVHGKNKDSSLYKTEFISYKDNNLSSQFPFIKTYMYSSFEGEFIYKNSKILNNLNKVSEIGRRAVTHSDKKRSRSGGGEGGYPPPPAPINRAPHYPPLIPGSLLKGSLFKGSPPPGGGSGGCGVIPPLFFKRGGVGKGVVSGAPPPREYPRTPPGSPLSGGYGGAPWSGWVGGKKNDFKFFNIVEKSFDTHLKRGLSSNRSARRNRNKPNTPIHRAPPPRGGGAWQRGEPGGGSSFSQKQFNSNLLNIKKQQQNQNNCMILTKDDLISFYFPFQGPPPPEGGGAPPGGARVRQKIKEIYTSLENLKTQNQYFIKDMFINNLGISLRPGLPRSPRTPPGSPLSGGYGGALGGAKKGGQRESASPEGYPIKDRGLEDRGERKDGGLPPPGGGIRHKFKIKVNNLSVGNAQQISKLLIGEFVVYGDQISPNFAVPISGQIIHLNNQKITIRRGQPIFVSPKASFHKHHRDFIDEYSPVITLSYQQLKAGDIIQGIPKVEQFFEARTTKRGRLFLDSLSNLLKELFTRYRIKFDQSKYPLDSAIRLSFYKIQQIIIDGVQRVYRSQGVSISDKHLEIIVKQMTSKVLIIAPQNSGFFPGEIISLHLLEGINSKLKAKMLYVPVVLGVTKASLEVDSFLSAASFQQTTRVLSQAAVFKRNDFLKGLKENAMLGNLMPAGTGYIVCGTPLRIPG